MLKDSEKSSAFHFVLVFFQTEILIYCIEIIFKNLKNTSSIILNFCGIDSYFYHLFHSKSVLWTRKLKILLSCFVHYSYIDP